MEEIGQEIKIVIHHVLNKYKFYRLENKQYKELLVLLQQAFVDNPMQIQQRIFRGIFAFNKLNRDKIAPVLMRPCFEDISVQSKILIHKILHEFHFLSQIRAFQIIQQQNKHSHSLNSSLFAHSLSNQLPFDDDYEKVRLNYLYYGSVSVYNINHIFSDQNKINNPGNSSIENGQKDKSTKKYNQNQVRSNFHPEIKAQNSKKIIQTSNKYKYQIKNQRNEVILSENNKYKAKQKEVKLNKALKNEQYGHYEHEKYNNCACKGILTDLQSFLCACGFYYHKECLKTWSLCIGCQIKSMDPFVKVKEVIDSFYITEWTNNSYSKIIKSQRIMNLRKGEEVMISCKMIGKSEICWPDDIIFKINGQPVFAIPGLLEDHQLKNRQDSSYFIKKYLQNQEFMPNNVQNKQYVLSFEVYQESMQNDSQLRRNNRHENFFFSMMIVQQRQIKELVDEVKAKNMPKEMVHPLKKIENKDSQMQLQSISISCLDPYSKNLLNIPVKGSHCLHFNCFDLQTFLRITYNSCKRGWKCPICKKDARMLQIERYQEYILQKIKILAKPPAKVIYYNNGQYGMQEGVELPLESQEEEANQ